MSARTVNEVEAQNSSVVNDPITTLDAAFLEEIESLKQELESRLGHPPRILHVGNVANNAYNNAKLFTQLGIQSDVICDSYYHIMGCPEWEDADFDGDVGDQFRPNWLAAGIGDYKRPRWFAQGPFHVCVEYLCAKDNSPRVAEEYWKYLGLANRTYQPSEKEKSGWTLRDHVQAFALMGRVLLQECRRYLRAMASPESVSRRFRKWVRWAPSRARDGLLLRAPESALVGVSRVLEFIWLTAMRAGMGDNRAVRLLPAISRSYRELVPESTTGPRIADLLLYGVSLAQWKRLFSHYDIVQGYATAPIYPFLLGRDYFAFEHGTLREIPFQEDAQGRLTALAYNGAVHTFVTNADCMDNARRLAGERVTFINHPYDEDHGLQVEGAGELRRALMQELDADFLFFFPTRHDWVVGTGYADKGNDVFLRAFAELRAHGHRVGVVCCRWGHNVGDSEALLEALGCSSHAAWREPMGMVGYDRMSKAADIVVDQFQLGAFGGVTFKALAAGAPVLTYLDVDEMMTHYPEPPPVVNCRTTEEIVQRMTTLMGDRCAIEALSRQSRIWIKTYHNSLEVVLLQLRAYVKYVRGASTKDN